MEKTLVVVESPAKAKTIKKYLGAGFDVKASVGHIKDLPKSAARDDKAAKPKGMRSGGKGELFPVLGVDVENRFRPQYVTIPGKEKIIKDLREAAGRANRVLLATDPDREGEAIAWHVSQELGKPRESIYRVLFNELTERTIREAVASPSRLDENKYNAQQARRILDRIVGYQLSPLLWEKVQSGLSAGRVQSVALRLIVDRQIAIDTFVPQEFWSLTASLATSVPPPFDAKLVQVDGKKAEIPDAASAQGLVQTALKHPFIVDQVKRQERLRKPIPPFITSTLQQDASRKLRMNSSRTMRVAQQLYEGLELGSEGAVGLITYMRTDSPRIAPEAVNAVRKHIREKYGAAYLPAKPNFYKGGKAAQEAHECIRPTSMDYPPEKVAQFLSRDQLAVYRLIWNRFVACQMTPAVYDRTSADIRAGGLLFRVTGSVLKFDGFLKVYQQDEPSEGGNSDKNDVDRQLPPLKKGLELTLNQISPRQHFTQPPAQFNEASLIKELEEQGIGRPSTYADIVTTIQKRKYVELEDKNKRFRPTILGRIIAGLLLESFPQLLDTQFTAKMESELDLIEGGSASWTETLESFYGPFSSDLKTAKEKMKNIRREGIPTGEPCPDCGRDLYLRSGRYGLFMGCSGYPDCGYTRNIEKDTGQIKEPVPTDEICPECGAPMVLRDSRSGPFLSCSRYPECKAARPLPTGVTCPKCGLGELVQRRSRKGKTFFSCSRYPECDHAMWNKPVAEKCPNQDCDSTVMEERVDRTGKPFLQCPKCKKRLEQVSEDLAEHG